MMIFGHSRNRLEVGVTQGEGGMKPEGEIMEQWRQGHSQPLVTVLCTTFNNAANIAQTLDSLLAQRTPFPFEVIVHDDASSDGTAEIIRRYAGHYPTILKPLLQRTNQLSRGHSPDTFTLPLCRGRYIALCEGDDYWTEEDKLARQVKMLEDNPECDLCFHRAYKRNVKTGDVMLAADYGNLPRHVTTQEVIEKRYGTITTATVMARRSVMEPYQAFMAEQEDKIVGDVYFQILGALRGGACYLPEPMAVYRFKVPGSWSDRHADHAQRRAMYLSRRIGSYARMNRLTGFRFDDSFRKASGSLVIKGVKETGLSPSERRSFYLEHSGCLRYPQRLLALAVLGLPGPLVFYRRVRHRFGLGRFVSHRW